MKQLVLICLIHVVPFSALAHEHGHGVPSRTWELNNSDKVLQADFIKEQDGVVYLSAADHTVLELGLERFSEKDRTYILAKSDAIRAVNISSELSNSHSSNFTKVLVITGTLIVLLSIVLFVKRRNKFRFAYGALGLVLIVVGCTSANSTTTAKASAVSTIVPANSVELMTAVFGVFHNVDTRHDERYFYIASNGIPEHEMMTGISNWQQQVPIPHDYSGDNSWAIPLQPKLAEDPLSTKTNFMKGAIAIAANGIPIFNPLNNRGEDANAIGELDHWGGHCGRADDYHYHLPPAHLQAQVGESKPIAYALDGFPVYGETTDPLDEYLGRFNADSSYEYHAVKDYPYLIAAMRGEVELDPRTQAPENEIMPQAKTRGVRPALRPLRGAEITGFKTIRPDQFALTYTLDDQTFVINYGWDDEGTYRFDLVGPDGTSSRSTYQRK